jgi:hypothetical protein
LQDVSKFVASGAQRLYSLVGRNVIDLQDVLLILTFGSFIAFWITAVIFYTPACHNLREMINSIDEDGELTRSKSSQALYGRSAKTVDDWLIRLPSSDKYLQYDIVKKTSNRIRTYRMLMAVLAPIMIICGAILILTVE